jgi:hypothetical protein
MQGRYRPRGCGIVWVLLPLIVASFCGISWAQSPEGRFPSPDQDLPDARPAAADFDGDRVVDLLTLDRTAGSLRLEIHFGRTHRVSVLPVDSSLVVAGSLTVRDLDNDGDSDLFWKGRRAHAPLDIIVWLNDGTGHFARLLSLNSRPAAPLPARSFRKEAFRLGPHYEGLPSKRASSPLGISTSNWTWQRRTSEQFIAWTVRPLISFPARIPSDRGPPALV